MAQGLDPNEVYINGKPYPVIGGVQPNLLAQWPAKVITGGDVTKDSHPFLSTQDFGEASGGGQLFKWRPGDPDDRYWYATAETRYRGQIGRRPKATTLSHTYISDTFTRANSSTTLGTPESPSGVPAWTAHSGTWGISSNQAYVAVSAGSDKYAGFTNIAPDLTVQCGVTVASGEQAGIFTRRNNDSNVWKLVYVQTNGVYRLLQRQTGTDTIRGSWTGAQATNFIGLVTRTSTIDCYVDATIRITYTSTFNQDYCGVGLSHDTTGTATRWDNFIVSPWSNAARTSTSLAGDCSLVGGLSHNYSGNLRTYFVWDDRMCRVDNTSGGTSAHVAAMTFVGAAANQGFVDIPTSVLEFLSGANLRIYICYDSGFVYSTDGAAWTVSTEDARYMVPFDSLLWKITKTGVFASSTTGNNGAGDWTAKGTLQGADGTYIFVQSLFTSVDEDGNLAIYATTNEALWKYSDSANEWIGPLIAWPRNNQSGRNARAVWLEQDSIMIPTGMDLLQYIPGSPVVVRNIGLSALDGVGSSYSGRIVDLLRTPQFLSCITMADGTGSAAQHVVWAKLQETSGWHSLYETSKTPASIATTDGGKLVYSTAYSQFRLYSQASGSLAYQRLWPGVANPRNNPTADFDTSNQEVQTSWYPGPSQDLHKTSLIVHARVSGVGSNDYIRISYATDLSESYTVLTNSDFATGLITTNGHHHFELDVNGDGVTEGKEFNYIKFKVEVLGGASPSSTANPLLEFGLHGYYVNLPASWSYTMLVDFSRSYKQRSPQQMYDELRALAENTTLVKFSWNADATTAHTYMVKLLQMKGHNVQTGTDPRSQYSITLVEPLT